ncbi:protein-arginine deiminase domain-containing protein [bacterium]|nr:protein-arginine deiminase domain-containing protein [bacterium]
MSFQKICTLVSVLTLLSSFQSVAFECPAEFSKRTGLPACPTKNGSVLADTYPVGALVVSKPQINRVSPQMGARVGSIDPLQQTYSFILSVATTQDNIPLIVLPLSQSDFDSLTAKLMSSSEISAEKKQQLRKRLAHANVSGAYNWQQDYFQATVSGNGTPQLRPNTAYTSHPDRSPSGEHFSAISSILSKCGVQTGAPLNPPDLKGLSDGMSGGNIESLPNGTCLIGDDHFGKMSDSKAYDKFVKSVCGSNKNISIPTHWLGVGHTDEILKVLPKKGFKPEKCAFSISIASPKLALELLEKDPEAPFFSPEKIPDELKQSDVTDFRREVNPSMNMLCTALDNAKIKHDESDPDTPSEEGTGKGQSYFKFLQKLLPSLIQQAQAAGADDNEFFENQNEDFFQSKSISDAEKAHKDKQENELSGSIAAPKKEKAEKFVTCNDASNKHMAKLFKTDPALVRSNNYVQAQMDILEQDLKRQLAKMYPGCNIEIKKVPQLFDGGNIGPDGKLNGVSSINPNPTNGVLIGDQYYIPDQANKTFQKYMRDHLKENGLKANFINTYDFAHSLQGNLHCSSQTIPLCR